MQQTKDLYPSRKEEAFCNLWVQVTKRKIHKRMLPVSRDITTAWAGEKMISWFVSLLVVLLVIAIIILDLTVLDGKIFVFVVIAALLFFFTALAHDMIFGG